MESRSHQQGSTRPWLTRIAVLSALGVGWAFGMVTGHERGYQQHQEEMVARPAREAPPRRNRPENAPPPPKGAGDMRSEDIEALAALGYVEGIAEMEGPRGVLVHDSDRAVDGYTLLVGANKPEATLIDMNGDVIHQWQLSFEAAFPDQTLYPERFGQRYWRRVVLLADGGLIAIFEGHGVIRIDKDSQLIWAVFNRAHHHAQQLSDDTIILLTREAGQKDGFHPTKPVVEDHLVWLNAETGEELRRLSVVDALLNSRYKRLFERTWNSGDVLHTNTIQVLDGKHSDRHPAMTAGRLLLTLPNLDALVVIDPEAQDGAGEVVWAMVKGWRFPHEGRLLDSGQMIIFDNQGHNSLSRVEIFDPSSHEVSWRYEGTPENGFYTEICGAVQQLKNGNLLLTESQDGRAFEITPDHQIVWEYRWEHRSVDDPELVAMLFDATRLEADDPSLAWLTPAQE